MTVLINYSNQIHEPQKGVTAFKVKNCFRNRNVSLEIEYVLKSDKNKANPNVKRIICRINHFRTKTNNE